MQNVVYAEGLEDPANSNVAPTSIFAAMTAANSQDKNERIVGIADLIQQTFQHSPAGDRARKFLEDRFGASICLSSALIMIMAI